MGAYSSVVQPHNGPLHTRTLGPRLPGTRVPLRFFGGSVSLQSTSGLKALCANAEEHWFVDAPARHPAESDEGELERCKQARAFGCRDRHPQNAICGDAAQASARIRPREGAVACDEGGAAMGRPYICSELLRIMRVTLTRTPLSRFYTRSLYHAMSTHTRLFGPKLKVRLSHEAVRDLRFWRDLARVPPEGRPIHPPTPTAALHSDAADTSWGGTLNTASLEAIQPGMWCYQGLWDWRAKASSISLRELRAVRLLLSRQLGATLQKQTWVIFIIGATTKPSSNF